MDAEQFKEHLTEDIIPFWNACVDEEKGGFVGSVDYHLVRDYDSDKGVILHSRILWFYSSAYLLFQDPRLLKKAEHVYDFLKQFCLDKEYGGMYWSVTASGEIADETKHTYNQAFAIYALSSYYAASNKEEVIETAYRLFDLIEEKCRDGEGYLEAYHRDFTPASNEKLSENGVMATRTMNTLLHIIEAYTELYRVDGNLKVEEKLRQALDLFCTKICNPEKGICEVFFDKQYHTLIDLESYGHDIEASWLLDRAGEILGDTETQKRLMPVVEKLAQKALEHAYDPEKGRLFNENEKGVIDKQSIWWVQAEGVTGFYNAYQRTGQQKYLEASAGLWNFIRQVMVDERSGEWFESVKEDGSVDVNQGIVHAWKCPYHNGRMCLEMIRRLSGTQKNANPGASQEAEDLLRFLHETAGNKILTGQHTQTNPMEEVQHIREVTGKEPRLVGFELLGYSPNIPFQDASEACLTEVYENLKTMDTALAWARNHVLGKSPKKAGILELTFHWFSPIGGRDKSFYAENTDFDARNILVEGTAERRAFYHDMDVIARELKRFQCEGIPVLWRPFHEADGTWFWWGAKGIRVARQLYRMMYDYYTIQLGLDNLVWVWSAPGKDGYPGDERVDVVACDVYLSEGKDTDYATEYEHLVATTSRKKVAALGEVGYLPDVELLQKSGVPWAYYMTWSKEFCLGEQYNSREKLKKMYESDYAISVS